MRMIVHLEADGVTVKKLEGIAPDRPTPKNVIIVNSADVPGKSELLNWNSDTSQLEIDAQRAADYAARDRRESFEKLVDKLVSDNILTPADKTRIME